MEVMGGNIVEKNVFFGSLVGVLGWDLLMLILLSKYQLFLPLMYFYYYLRLEKKCEYTYNPRFL